MLTRADAISSRYSSFWQSTPTPKIWKHGPIHDLPPLFRVLEFAPSSRNLWTYATCEMSQPTDEFPIELHLFSPTQSDQHIELLTTIAHYHRTGHPLNLHHTVNFGRPWLPGSLCDHGLISLPYLDGPRLELLQLSDSKHPIRCLWLLPITQSAATSKSNSAPRHSSKSSNPRTSTTPIPIAQASCEPRHHCCECQSRGAAFGSRRFFSLHRYSGGGQGGGLAEPSSS